MFWKKKNKAMEGSEQNGSPLSAINLSVVVKTDLGCVRNNNEDSAAAIYRADEPSGKKKGHLLVVADGMGGHNAGEVASAMAVEIIGREYFKHPGHGREKILGNALHIANKEIYEKATTHAQYQGMGTTCTALAVVDCEIYYAHAGDSRAYHYRNNSVTRITEDHTFVQELVNNGSITAAEADTHPQRNILTNAMGTKPALKVDTGKYARLLDPGDRLLICSDGLYDYLDDHEIAAMLSYPSLQHCTDQLIAEAKKRGGADNITVVLAAAANASLSTPPKTTRDVMVPKLTRDAALPLNQNGL